VIKKGITTMKKRFTTCLLLGVLVAAVLAWFSAKHRHAGLVAAAAKSHQSTGAYLAVVSGGVVLFVTVVTFILASIIVAGNRSRSRSQRQASNRRGRSSASHHPGPGWSER
jgi:hypothetical protein